MSDNDKRLSLEEVKQKKIKLKKELTNDEVGRLIDTLYGICAGYTNISDGSEHTDMYPRLKEIIQTAYKSYGPKPPTKPKQPDGRSLREIRQNTSTVLNRVRDAVKAALTLHPLIFYKPIDYGEADAKDYLDDKYKQYTKDNEMEVEGERVSSAGGQAVPEGNDKKWWQMPNVEIKLGRTTDEILRRIKEPSVEEQMNKMYTELAKNKRFMSLSESQMKKLLKDEYELDDEGVDIMFNAIVAKRAELLANNRLKREQLTDVDVERLQEQSQRDFERKLHDQNLRYLLPAMLEKRDRLVVNRLNPELLKCGY